MGKDDATWLNVSYVCFTFLGAYIFYKAFEMAGIQLGWVERYDWFAYASTALAVVLGIVIVLAVRSSSSRNEYYLSAIAELRKVTWPSWPDTKRMTIIVAVVVAFFAVIVSVFDFLWSGILKFLVS